MRDVADFKFNKFKRSAIARMEKEGNDYLN